MKRIDLIPQEAKKITPKKWLRTYFLKSRTLRITVIALTLLIFINIWQVTSILRYRIAITSGKKNILKLKAKVNESQSALAELKGERESVEREIKRIEGKLEALIQTHRERYVWAEVLKRLSKLVPRDLWINKLRLNKELVTIAGTTFSNALVSDFMTRLDESDYFRETSFNYTEKTKLTGRSVIDFEVTTHVVLEKLRR